jgi:hypothetical protein
MTSIFIICAQTYFVQQKQGCTSWNNIEGLIIFHIYIDNNTSKHNKIAITHLTLHSDGQAQQST